MTTQAISLAIAPRNANIADLVADLKKAKLEVIIDEAGSIASIRRNDKGVGLGDWAVRAVLRYVAQALNKFRPESSRLGAVHRVVSGDGRSYDVNYIVDEDGRVVATGSMQDAYVEVRPYSPLVPYEAK